MLGASLHDVLTRLKAEAQLFSRVELTYDQVVPVTEPVIVGLPDNGLRLRFDGPEQRLRLVEILDFRKSQLTHYNKPVFRHATLSQTEGEKVKGPTLRHIHQSLFGPTYPGEYVPTDNDNPNGPGVHIISWPGIAFSFSMKSRPDAALLSSSAAEIIAMSMAIFVGDSWPMARDNLFTTSLNPRAIQDTQKIKDPVPDEVCAVKIHGAGKLEVVRHEGVRPYLVQLGITTPQDLVASLGPPDAIYRKYDKRMSIHQSRPAHRSHPRNHSGSRTRDESTDTDVSSAYTITDDSDDAGDDGEIAGNVSGDCFYNYFYHGFDILFAPPSEPSQIPPSQRQSQVEPQTPSIIPGDTSRVVATKFILHGNVPGSYQFNRHRRCRWEVAYLATTNKKSTINSETTFNEVQEALFEEWKGLYKDDLELEKHRTGMPLNRGWENSPESSVEFIAGWEESMGEQRPHNKENGDSNGLGVTLYGFPGLVFEVLHNGTVSNLTVF